MKSVLEQGLTPRNVGREALCMFPEQHLIKLELMSI